MKAKPEPSAESSSPSEKITLPALAGSLFADNDQVAEENHALLRHHRIKAIDIMGSSGSGKTSVITRLVEKLRSRRRVAVINGDPVTSDDIDPIARQGIPVVQIAVDGWHLDAELVARGYEKLQLPRLDLILVENVGSLISPGEIKLGSSARVVVVSVTEGAWTVRKHPRMFLDANLVVINKLDLASTMGVDVEQLKRDVQTLRPNLQVIGTSCTTAEGIDALASALLDL